MTAIAAQIAPAVSEQTPDDPVSENNPAQELSPSVSLIPYFAELICSEGISEKLFALRFDALRELQGLLSQYDKRGYSAKLLNSIGEKKGAMIMSADSKTEVNKILRPKAPHYDGVRFVSDQYLLPEEELITSPPAHATFLLFPASPGKNAVIFGDNQKRSDDYEQFFHVN